MRHYAQKGLFHANLLHTLLELFPVTDGTILDFGARIIDSVHRIVKELGNLRTVLDAQTDKVTSGQWFLPRTLLSTSEDHFIVPS